MTTLIGINGFGRIGRLVVRALAHHPKLQLVHINEMNGGIENAAHLMQFDSVHGKWKHAAEIQGTSLLLNKNPVRFTEFTQPSDVPWRETGVEIVLECTGAFKTMETLATYLDEGVRKVVVAAPVHDDKALNIVMGCNDDLYDPETFDVVTAASCTTNCIAPVVKVLHEEVGIEKGLITTIHNPTNTQVVVDSPHTDLRRSRSALNSLIPTSTGSATAITKIFPELSGKLDGISVRVPILNASLSDCVFSLTDSMTVPSINELLESAASSTLSGILGFEHRPLVSADYVNDTRSGIVDGQSTIVVDGNMVKVLVWYDNEYGYVHRLAELVAKVAASLPPK
ncbi:MAG: ArsJ-associated glyceraldehyde-3-phosphate dehydrogenase [Acidimicrobiales bacterium]|nr:ArsJ-associated glyceraldehyde-3-phosphate dehydrogenase [Acidimicrobiales bacterium]MDG1845481.1 ArsJ-associated glyceraldehyde-3-phosphate dehydrogenase [Acidimicrobiales bacterium]